MTTVKGNLPRPEQPSRSRREFLRKSVVTAVAAPVALTAIASCSETSAQRTATASDSDHSGGSTAPHPSTPAAPVDPRARADQMDAMHEKGVKAFPAKTEGKGNQILTPRVMAGVKIFDITCKVVQWEVEPGRKVEAWAFNGVVPGPQIRVMEGDRIRMIVKNELPESTAVHFHGVETPNAMDGVPFITQPPIKPGETFTYEFVVPNAGSHMYHSHHNAAKQVGMGLLGAFIVAPKHPRAIEKADLDYVMILNDGFHGYTLNGKGFLPRSRSWRSSARSCASAS